jgi:hypothetical protein
MAVKLGSKVKDSITGYEGIAVQRIEYLYGCVRIGVEGKVGADGKVPGIEYFDEQRVDPKSTVTTGGAYDAPASIAAPGRTR